MKRNSGRAGEGEAVRLFRYFLNELRIVNASRAGIKRLYHYQRYREDQVLDMVKNRRIRCSNLANLNDPWDCKLFFKVDDLKSAAKTIAAFQAVARPSSRGSDYDRIMDEVLSKDPVVLKELVDRATEKIDAHSVEWRRLYCLTPHLRSTLMWSHYAENHKGICLAFAVKPGNVFAAALKVLYNEDFLPFEFYKSETTALIPFLVKAHCWSYEDEYRLLLRIKEPDAENVLPKSMLVTDNCFPLAEGCLESIMLGCETPHEIGIRIRQLIDENGQRSPLNKCTGNLTSTNWNSMTLLLKRRLALPARIALGL